jgi:CelD/BcsL family acetyltransferase involved in cellulose biosynthesis/aminoglycoside phosphotransferase (APT) family kinase protein
LSAVALAPSEEARAHPRHGWLVTVIPADARRFRARDPELALTLATAGAKLVDREPDVEVGRIDDIAGDAPCAVVELGHDERLDAGRFERGVRRGVRSVGVGARAARARRRLRALGYPFVDVLNWEHGVAVTASGTVGRRPLAHRFPVNAVVVGTRERGLTSAFEASRQAAEAALGRPLRPTSTVLGASGVVIAMAGEGVFRVAMGPAARRIDEQRAALDVLRRSDPGPGLAGRVPWFLQSGSAGLAAWSVERRLRGETAPPVPAGLLLRQYLDFLVELNAMRSSGPAPAASRGRVDAVARLCDLRLAQTISELAAAADHELRDVPRGFMHGDFWTGNLLVDDERLVGVVDWPAATADGLPVLDLLHLEVSAIRERTGLQLGGVLMEMILPRSPAVSELYRLYCRRIGLELTPAQWTALVTTYWLHAAGHELLDPDRDPKHAHDPAWISANVEVVAAALARRRRRRPVTPSGDDRAVEIVEDTAVLDGVVAEWRQLAERLGNPFVTPEWFFTSLRHAPESTPFVPVVRRADGHLVGLLPLLAARSGISRTIRFAGADNGDYFEPVAADADGQLATVTATANALAGRDSKWGMFIADYAAEGAHWLSPLTDSPAFASVAYHDHPSIYRLVDTAGHDWDSYRATLSRNLREQLRRKLGSLEREHEVRFRRTLTSDDLERDLARLFEMHRQRWSGRGGTFLTDETVRAFHLDFAEAALERGWLRLWSLEADDQTIAAWYGWSIGSRYLYYQAGFDETWQRYSPGLLMLARTVRAAIEEGAAEYDMLIGDEPYKSRFANRVREGRTIVVTRPLHPARAIVEADLRLRRAIRRLPPDLHGRAREVAEPVLRRWPVKTAP